LSKRVFPIAVLACMLAAIFGFAACGGGGIPTGAVAEVDGKPITKATFGHWMNIALTSSSSEDKSAAPQPPDFSACIAHLRSVEPKPAKGQKAKTEAQLKTECERQYKALQEQVIGFLISSQWVIEEAKSLGVHLSDAEVKKELVKEKNAQFPESAEFEKFLKTSGNTVSDLLLTIKAEHLLPQKIEANVIKDKGKVTQAQVEKYFKGHPSQFGTEEKRDVRIVLRKTEAQAKQAKQEIASGKSFASVAKAKSIDPTSKKSGGLLKDVVRGEEQKALSDAIFSAKKNALGGPIKTPFGYYIYEVTGITAATHQSLARSQAQIKQQLQTTDQQKALSEFIRDFKKKWLAKTECRSGYLMVDCKEYKAPKSAATRPAIGG
jgi:foldase protein PrsA